MTTTSCTRLFNACATVSNVSSTGLSIRNVSMPAICMARVTAGP